MITQPDLPYLFNPSTCLCSLRHYEPAYSTLQIQAYQPETGETFLLNFYGVEYFDGPVAWQSADFRLETTADALALLRAKSPGWAALSDHDLRVRFQLYTLDAQDLTAAQVRIIAEGCVVTALPPARQPHTWAQQT